MRRPVIRKRHEERVERARLSLARSMSTAAADVLAERQRQQGVEGWAHRHDDAHSDGSLAAAAAVYAMTGSQPELRMSIATYNATLKALWPSSWYRGWFKRKDSRRDLVRAGALIIAEIERLDRKNSARKPRLVDAVIAHLMTLEGEALDRRLRELGFDPEQLLAEFDKAVHIATQ